MKTHNADNFSREYWESRYTSGGNSGSGSYGNGLMNKITLLNKLISAHNIRSIADIGCGDCTILNGMTPIDRYIGYDISPTIINRHIVSNTDPHREFRILNNSNSLGYEVTDLTLSLEVIFHQVNDNEYIEYMNTLIATNSTFILILTMNEKILDTHHVKSTHVTYRDITAFMNLNNTYELVDTFPFTVDTSTYYLYAKNKPTGDI